MKKRSQQGVALVITLILLSVITFMAVTFLVVSRHEGAQVDTVGQQTSAKFAADAASQEAIAQIVGNMLATGNGLNFGLLVSTNYINGYGFQTGKTNLVNVSYNYPDGTTLSAADYQILQNNLLILPRPPVFVTTNKGAPLDFRFYLDLNRNGLYDTNGAVTEKDASGATVVTNYVGDPEWVGILNHPDQRHSSSNLFVARYAFIAVPIGNSLDINYIHNQSKLSSLAVSSSSTEGFLRNQGVGSWEINLAGFLHALNTNVWLYASNDYKSIGNLSFNSTGTAFQDAGGVMQFRNNGSYNNLHSFYSLYMTNIPSRTNAYLFRQDFIDGYSTGPLFTNTSLPTFDNDSLYYNSPWPGDSSPNQFFTTQDFFNVSTNLTGFSNRLQNAGTLTKVTGTASSANSYNRYSYYRMLAQMGTDSSPEPAPYPYTSKINLNYNNLAPEYSPSTGNSAASSTNFLPWTPIAFFTNAADRMLRATFPNPVYVTNLSGFLTTNFICITNIPIYPTNVYTPAVNRILQLAANIYDATINKATNATPLDFDFPSVFRPIFTNRTGIVSITGYAEVTNDTPYLLPTVSLPQDYTIGLRNITNVYGIPYIIGAKTNLPNFNELSMASVSQITRKIKLTKPSLSSLPNQTNILYNVGLSNVVAVEVWNSYSTPNYRSIDISCAANVTMVLSNETRIIGSSNLTGLNSINYYSNYAAGQWPGYTSPNAFVIPIYTNVWFITNEDYHASGIPNFLTASNGIFDANPGTAAYVTPQFVFTMTNKLVFFMKDHASGRLIDYVSFNITNFYRNLSAELAGLSPNAGFGDAWSISPVVSGGTDTYGIKNQIQASMGQVTVDWNTDITDKYSVDHGTNGFIRFMGQNATNTVAQAPYTPTAKIYVSYSWQANDPLVHYLLSDLTGPLSTYPQSNYLVSLNVSSNLIPNIGKINSRYLPWGNVGNTLKGVYADQSNVFNMAVKDPMVVSSSSWQFPNNKFPNIGWLGRVHRGTPWQTVYLKPMPVNPVNWRQWTGNYTTNYFRNQYTSPSSGITTPGYPDIYDAVITMPTNDWALLDLFTTAPNDNASRGQLSVNQTNLAAWAAVLDGVIALTNDPAKGILPWVISPPPSGGVDTVEAIVNSINSARTNFPNTNSGSGAFSSVGQILSVPLLTTNSPYICWTNQATNLITDAVVERIPQQILSLLRVGSPRYVIYAYGQSLKPANNSIVQSGPYFGMCTNYQITGEVATKTVVRIENYPLPGVANTKGYHPRAVVESFNVLPPE